MGRNFKDIPIEDKINIYGNTVDGMFEEFCRKEEKFLSEAEGVIEAALATLGLDGEVTEIDGLHRTGVLKIERVKRTGDGLFYLAFYPYMEHKRSFQERKESDKPALYKCPVYRVRIRPARAVIGLKEAQEMFAKKENE